MSQKALNQSIWREIKASFGRFISIFLIVALGVAFYAGVKGSAPVMKKSADTYFDDYHLMDIQLLSTLGLDDEDLSKIQEMNQVESVYGGYSVDVLVQQGNVQQVFKTLSLPSDYQDEPQHYLNRLKLVEGRLPAKKGECVVESASMTANSPDVGTTLTLQSGTEDSLSDTLDCDTYTVVGKVYTPYYLSDIKGASAIGSGSVDWYIYILEDHFKMDYYSEAYVSVKDVRSLHTYEDEYFDMIDPLVEQIESKLQQSVTARYLDLYDEGTSKLADAKEEYQDGKEEFEQAISDAKQEIEDGYQKVLDGEETLKEEEQKALQTLADAKQQLEDGEKELADGEKEYQEGLSKFEAEKKDALANKVLLEDGIQQCEDAIKDLNQNLETVQSTLDNPVLPDDAIQQLKDGKAQIEDGLVQANTQLSELKTNKTQIDAGMEQCETIINDLNNQLTSINDQLENPVLPDEAIQQLKDGKAQIEDGLTQATTKLSELQTNKLQIEAGIEQCEAAINELNMQLEFVNAQLSNPDLPQEMIAQLQAGKVQIEAGLVQANAQLSEMQVNKTQIDAGMEQCETIINDLNNQLASINAQLDNPVLPEDAIQQLKDGKVQIEDGLTQATTQLSDLENNKVLVEDGIVQCENAITELNTQLTSINAQLENPVLPAENIAELEAAKVQIEDGLTQANDQLSELQSNLALLEDGLADGESQLQDASQQLQDAKIDLEKGWQEYYDGKAEAETKISDGKAELVDARMELEDAKITLEEERIKGEKELADGWDKISDAEKELEKLEEPDTYVLDRHKHYSYMDYGSAADRMAAIAKIFPVFFFLVAALVCLTTMTRMVDEHRLEIGTLKALGYSRFAIAKKYVAYAAIASISGGIFGAVVGLIAFPMIIYYAWGLMYHMGDIVLLAQIPTALTAIGLCSGITILAALGACYKEVLEVPSQLMRPKAPKSGKKIILERIPFIWNRFSFSYKVTARNIFRYKKRFFMTVIGISGCTALLLSGYGIQDSIGSVSTSQYGEVFKFDANISLDEDVKDYQDLINLLSQNDNTNAYGSLQIEPATYEENGSEKTLEIYIPMSDDFNQFISIHDRTSKESYQLSDKGVIVSEKLASRLNAEVGDLITIKNQNDQSAQLKVEGICENYVGHIIYMTPSYYEESFKEKTQVTNILVDMQEVDEPSEQAYGELFMQEDAVTAITFNAVVSKAFDDTIRSISFIVLVLTVSAGLLAFIVLYNLTTVNVSERIREIATIKVLGFTNKEVASYVYRENIVLTMIGGLCGLGLGIWLHQVIMALAELENVMFGRNIEPISYVLSFVITIVFAFLVNLIMYPKLSNVQMVESLKSIE